MLASSSTLAILAHTGQLAIWHIGVAIFINGIGWAADAPVRRMIIGEVVGPDRLGAAMSLDVASNTGSRIFGPIVGGILLATVGIQGAFTFSVALYVVAAFAAIRIAHRHSPQSAPKTLMLMRMAEGFRIAVRNPQVGGILALTVLYDLFGWPFISMIPVIGRDNLGLGPEGVGILAGAEGAGAFVAAMLIGFLARPVHYARLCVGGIALCLAMQIAFAFSSHPVPAGSALLLVGMGNSGFVVMQTTLVYLAVPAEMRGRMLGVLATTIGLGPIGFIHIGLVADAIGAQWATIISGLEGIVALVLTYHWWRPMWNHGVKRS